MSELRAASHYAQSIILLEITLGFSPNHGAYSTDTNECITHTTTSSTKI